MSETEPSIARDYESLDAYLAYLEQYEAPVDGAWYRKVGPDLYELQTGNLRILGGDDTQKRTFTRAELEKKFGFSR